MNPFKVLNARRRRLLIKYIKGVKFDRNLVKFIFNHLRWLALRREKNCIIPHPTNLMLELSAVCNLHCIMCAREFKYGKEMDKGFMPLEQVKRIVDMTLPYLTSIGLTGLGETLLYPHFAEICRYIKGLKSNVIISISTNAQFKEYLDTLKEAIDYIDNIQISVDGIGATYEEIRPNTSFENVKVNILATSELCRNRGVEFKLNFVIMPQNFMDMKKIVDLAKETGAQSVEFNQMNIASNPSKDRRFYDFFTSEPYLKAVSELRQYAREKSVEISLMDFDANSDFKKCNFPWDHPYITWNGYFIPCCGKPFPKLLNFGNVFESESIMDVLNSPKAQAFRRAWQKGQAPSFCKNCQHVDF